MALFSRYHSLAHLFLSFFILSLLLLVNPIVHAADDISLEITGNLIEGRIGLPGDQVLWEIVLTNHGIAPETNLLILTVCLPELQVEDIAAPEGQVSIIGESVVVALAELHSGDSLRFILKTIILSSPDTGLLEMDVILDGREAAAHTSLQVARVTVLPATGQAPWWRLWLLLVLGVCLVIGTVVSLCRLERATF